VNGIRERVGCDRFLERKRSSVGKKTVFGPERIERTLRRKDDLLPDRLREERRRKS